MDQINIEKLGALEDDVLVEVVREAERLIDAQLQTANSADQRASSWASILVTAAVATAGGAAALLATGGSLFLAAVGVCISCLLGAAIWFAALAVRPREWNFPGNRPRNWLPELWQCHGTGQPCDLRQARIEQAAALDVQIAENDEINLIAGKDLRLSMDIAFIAVVLGALSVGCYLIVEIVI